MKKYILSALVAALLPVSLLAQESVALPFLRIDRSAITSAMGGAEALSPLYNPAVVPFRGGDIAFSYQSWAPGGLKSTNMNLLGGIKIGKRLSVNLIGAYQSGQAYSLTDVTGKTGSSFVPSDLLAGAGVGFAITDFLSVGVNFKYAQSTIASGTSYSAMAGDAFVLFTMKGFYATAGVASLGTPVKSGDTSYALPGSVKVGLGYDAQFGTSGLLVAADADVFLAGGLGMAVGLQYDWKDMVFARGGFHVGSGKSPLPTYASLGLGAKFFGIHLDVSYLLGNAALANTLCVGVGYAF